MLGDAVQHFEGVIKELNDHRKVVKTFEEKLEEDTPQTASNKEDEAAKIRAQVEAEIKKDIE